MVSRERLTIEVYRDILRASHHLRKLGKATLHSVGYEANLPNKRLKERVTELLAMGLLDSGWAVSQKGYQFCDDYKRNVDPFLRKYGLNDRD